MSEAVVVKPCIFTKEEFGALLKDMQNVSDMCMIDTEGDIITDIMVAVDKIKAALQQKIDDKTKYERQTDWPKA